MVLLSYQRRETEWCTRSHREFNISDLEPDASSCSSSAANSHVYPVWRVYTYDAVSGAILYEEYHPFGTSAYRAVDSTIEVSPKRYRYAAAERDEETGLDHMGLRYYVPWLGRWTSADPIGLGDGVNRYAYVHGNPVSMRDPGGTFAQPQEQQPLTPSELVEKSEAEIRSHPTYFDVGITGITYYGEDQQARIEYESGESLTVDTSDIRTQPIPKRTPGTVAFGASPADLVEPEVPSDFMIDEPSGRIVPGEINVENAPVFVSMLRQARVEVESGTLKVGEAGVAIYSDWRFQALVLSPSPNQLLAPPPASPSLSATRSPGVGSTTDTKAADIALGLGSHRGKRGSQTLANFARHTKSAWYRQWADKGIASPKPGETLMSQSFIERGMQAARRIHFNLEGLTPEAFRAFAKDPQFGYGNITNWELQQILTTDLARKTTFYGKGGKEMSLDAVRRLYQ